MSRRKRLLRDEGVVFLGNPEFSTAGQLTAGKEKNRPEKKGGKKRMRIRKRKGQMKVGLVSCREETAQFNLYLAKEKLPERGKDGEGEAWTIKVAPKVSKLSERGSYLRICFVWRKKRSIEKGA